MIPPIAMSEAQFWTLPALLAKGPWQISLYSYNPGHSLQLLVDSIYNDNNV